MNPGGEGLLRAHSPGMKDAYSIKNAQNSELQAPTSNLLSQKMHSFKTLCL